MDLDYKIWTDPGKNRLYLVIKGSISDDMAKSAADKTMEEAKKLQSGFAVVSDISQARPTGSKGATEIKRAQAFLGYLGVKRIIQVVPRSDNGADKQQGYPAVNTVFSIDEADIILDRSA
ncbi:MAG: hypothetical protein RDU76_09130 [Candidatus Edwardsbacteria bacterium]|nr:hypothetical protein [Candidatus Edwardsbacteria bacterium]